MRSLPLTMFGPLLPGIARSLGAGLAQTGWIIATYATGSLIAQPVMGRVSDRRGRKIVLLWCIALFGVGSAICALSTSLWALVGGRIVQALGAGGVQPVVTATIADRWPPRERGPALGAVYGTFGIGTMVGALVGGGAVDAVVRWSAGGAAFAGMLAAFPWHAVFWLNVVVAAFAAAAALRIGDDEPLPPAAGTAPRFDVAGVALIGAFAVCLMVAATTSRSAAIAAVVAAVCCLLALPWVERNASAPLFDPALLRSRGPALVYTIAFLFGVPSFSLTIYSATYFIAQFNAGAAQSGLALFVLACAYVAGSIVGGALVKRIGAVPPLVGGIVAAGSALSALALATSLPAVVAAMALGGLGLGFASAPPNALLLDYVTPAQAGAASGLAIMLATSGSITAPAAISAFLHYGTQAAAPELRGAFAMGAVLCGICAALSAALPRPARSDTGRAGGLV